MFYIDMMISRDYGSIGFENMRNGFKRKIYKMLGLKKID